jgi:hypothetical protein
MNERNHWFTFPGDFIVRWGAYLPPPRGTIDKLVQFGVRIADAGKRHAVYRVVRLPGRFPYDADQQPFESHLREVAQQYGRVPLFPGEANPHPTGLWTPARIAFYRGDVIVEEEVGNVGALLRDLRPEQIETRVAVMRSASPVAVIGSHVRIDETREVLVEVRLETDIWFPWVLGMVDDYPQEGQKPERYDNRALAERHTPRLNAFLAELRQLAADLGGRWEPLEVDGLSVKYAPMWDATGIHLSSY